MSELTRYEIYVDKDGKIQANKWEGDKWIKVGEAPAVLAEKDAEIKKLQEENRILLAGISTIVDFARWSLNVMDDSIAKIKGVSEPEEEEKKVEEVPSEQ